MAKIVDMHDVNKKTTLSYINELIGRIRQNQEYFSEAGYKEEVEADAEMIDVLEAAVEIISSDDEY